MAAIDSIRTLKERGMTQAAIARALNVQPKVISMIATGERDGKAHVQKLAALVRKTPQPIPIEGQADGPNANGGGDRTGTVGIGTSTAPSASQSHYARAIPDNLRERLDLIRSGYADGSLASAIGFAGYAESADRPISQNVAPGSRQYGENQLRNAANYAVNAGHDSGNRQTAGYSGGSDGAARDSDGGAGASQRESESDRRGPGRPAARKGLNPLPFPGRTGKGDKAEGASAPKSAGGFTAYFPWLQGQKPLDVDEASAIREDVIYGLEQLEAGVDEIISNTNKAREEAAIWSTIDREDNEFLADGLIHWALKDPAVAWAVRGIAHSSNLLRAGVILLPRFVESVRFYASHGGLTLPL